MCSSDLTNIWLWGLGSTPQLTTFADLYGKRGAMITAVDLLRGLAALIGWQRIEVPGATGYLDTDYAAKGRYAVAALEDYDLVCVHVEATDEASHEGNAAAKIKALEEIDRHIVAPVFAALKNRGDYRIMVTPDHPTPLRTKTHSHGYVPFAIAGSGVRADGATTYDDITADRSPLVFDEGWRLMGYFLGTTEGFRVQGSGLEWNVGMAVALPSRRTQQNSVLPAIGMRDFGGAAVQLPPQRTVQMLNPEP